MTRQRLRESSVRWNMTLSLDSFALKIIKKSEELGFLNKAKIINIYIPEKVKNFIEENLAKEIAHFKKRNKVEFNLISDKSLILPEYKIDLLNKNKKVIKEVKNIETIEKNLIKQDYNRKQFHDKKFRNKFNKKNKFRKYKFKPKVKKNNFEKKQANI